MDIRSFNIPASNRVLVDDKLAKLSKRSMKLGLEEITWAWGKAYEDNDIVMLPLDLSGPLKVSYSDWNFIATLQHLPTGENIIRAVSSDIDIPLEYRDTGSSCQHCMVKRYRKDTYLVQHEINKSVVQVGSSCIKDFLGGESPDNLASRAQLISEINEFLNGSMGRFCGKIEDSILPIVKFLAQTSACIRDYGWVSKSKAQEAGRTPTVVFVQDNLFPDNINPGFQFSKITDEDAQLAKEAADWAENMLDIECENSDYLHNIRAIARSGMVGWRTMGYAASIVSSYLKRILPPKVKNPSQYIGEIKDKYKDILFLTKYHSFYGGYGLTHYYIFEDNNSNVLIWKSTRDMSLSLGNKYCISGTIKDHKEYKETKQTILTRCKVEEFIDN